MDVSRIAVYIITYVFEFAVVYVYCRNMFQSRFNKNVEISVGLTGFVGVGLILYMASYTLFFKKIVWINMLFFAVFYCCYIACMFNIRWQFAVMYSVIFTSVMAASEAMIYSAAKSVTFFFDDSASFKKLLVNTFESKLLYALLMYILFHINRKIKNINAGKGLDRVLQLAVVVSIISTFGVCALLAIIPYIYFNSSYDRIIFGAVVLIMFPNIAMFAIYIYLQRKNDEFSKLQLQLQKERDSMEYYRMLLSRNESQSILIHDIKKHLQSIALLNDQNEHEKIASYIDSIINSSDLQQSVQICDNKLLNAIINRYLEECRNKNIRFHADIRKDTVNFMKEDNLTALFCNILDNAYTAASKAEDSFIELNVRKGENTDYTVITMKNSCGENPFLPRRKNKGHGYGLKSVERIAALYDGHMETYFEDDENVYHTIVVLKNT